MFSGSGGGNEFQMIVRVIFSSWEEVEDEPKDPGATFVTNSGGLTQEKDAPAEE